ncbi:hypothetical protein C1N70_10935 [Cytobacillus firmus]
MKATVQGRQALDEPCKKVFFPSGEGIGLCLESLGAATRQACDLEGVSAGAGQLSTFKSIFWSKTCHLYRAGSFVSDHFW